MLLMNILSTVAAADPVFLRSMVMFQPADGKVITFA